MYAVPVGATHAVVIVIEFTEGEPEERVVNFGTFEQCDAIAREMPAVSYSGERTAISAHVSVYPLTHTPTEERPGA